MNTKKGIITIVLVAAMLVSMTGMASANTQSWRLHDIAYSETPAKDGAPHGVDKLMNLSSVCSGDYAEVTISSTQPAWWYDNVAGVDSTFGDESWQAHIYHSSTGLTGNVLLGEVWLVWDNGTMIKQLATGTGTILEGAPSTLINMLDNASTSQEFSVGQRLAFRLCTESTVFNIKYDGTNGCSTLESPESDPGFPVPELSTIILTSTGLLALLGYIGYRRRDNE